MPEKKQISVVLPENEFRILENHCNNVSQSKTAVVRELIRKLGEENAAKAVASLQGG
jgi:predicted DNA-binding protein